MTLTPWAGEAHRRMNATRQTPSQAPGATSVKSLLLRYAFTIAYNNWLRSSRFSADQKHAAMAAAGDLLWPLGVLRGCAHFWWLLTGRNSALPPTRYPTSTDLTRH